MKLSSVGRINFTIVTLCMAAIMLSHALGILPDERTHQQQTRAQLSEAVAASVMHLVSLHDYRQIRVQFETLTQRNDDLLSIGLRRHDDKLLASSGEHAAKWLNNFSSSTDGCFVVPIHAGGSQWGQMELYFRPLHTGINQYFSPTLIRLGFVLVPLIGITCWLHLKRVLTYLDPTQVVPPRVRQTLNSFSEGVVLLDNSDRIVLCNGAFSSQFGIDPDKMLGKRLGELNWKVVDEKYHQLPWELTKKTKKTIDDSMVSLQIDQSQAPKIYSVNSSAVIENGKYQGVMIVLADVTPLEQKRAELASTLQVLNKSREEISKQNEELRYLATRDPLTGCINRRTFFEDFERLWNQSKETGMPLCAMMVDIDFFKSINDNYGHSMGDAVLRDTGALLNKFAREDDIVCRYGGEEFSVLMPGLTLDQAVEAGERIRIAMSELEFPEFSITASLGLSEVQLGAEDTQGLLDQADQCLYVAKRNGRNQVVRFDDVPEDLVVDESKISRTKPEEVEEDKGKTIPFAAVSALVSALTYRDAQTGSHSVRVSNYSALLAQKYLGPREAYVVEIAGLLHDIGKIGVPDAILLKPGKLSDDEWQIMHKHDRIGVEIIKKSFQHSSLTEAVRFHHCRYEGSPDKALPTGTDIPLGARILTIADSFDAMVSDRPYRRGMPVGDAIAELRRCSGTQFDPELVEEFVEIIQRLGLLLERKVDAISDDVMLSIGDQVERIVDAADDGDVETFLALTERLRLTAEQSNLREVADAASHAQQVATEEDQLRSMMHESFELLAACRSMHTHAAALDEQAAAR